MAGKGPRHLIKRELDRATNNLEMFKTHLFTIRQQCEIGNRTDLMEYVDGICKGAIALQSTIISFGLVVDGKLPVADPEPPA